MSLPEDEPPMPMPRCDICATGEAYAMVNGLAVCSEYCADEAQERDTPAEADQHRGRG